MFAAESTPLPCGPPAIQAKSPLFILYHSDSFAQVWLGKKLAAGHRLCSTATIAERRLSTIWTTAGAFVDEPATSLTNQFLFQGQFSIQSDAMRGLSGFRETVWSGNSTRAYDDSEERALSYQSEDDHTQSEASTGKN
jgi:hypothetical protein